MSMRVGTGQERVIEIPPGVEREVLELDSYARALVLIDENPRLQLEAILIGENASLEVVGGFRGEAADEQRLTLRIVQRGPRTDCRVDIRAALRDASSSWFDGLIRIEEGAIAARGFLSYRALILSDQAHAKPIPRLEVLTKQVASTGHAASVSKIDPQNLFYLQSRGLSAKEAENLIIKGFLKYTYTTI